MNMDWLQVLTIVGANIGIFLWLRTEASADRRQMQSEAAADRRDILQIIREIQEESKEFHCAMKDLNCRILLNEERTKRS
jgi:hypothetical protein